MTSGDVDQAKEHLKQIYESDHNQFFNDLTYLNRWLSELSVNADDVSEQNNEKICLTFIGTLFSIASNIPSIDVSLVDLDDKVLARLWNSFADDKPTRDRVHKVIQTLKANDPLVIPQERTDIITLTNMFKEAFHDRPWINELQIKNDSTSPQNFLPKMADIVRGYPSIRKLSFWGGDIETGDLVNMMKQNAITSLSFNDVWLGNESNLIADAIVDGKTLTHLTVSQNNNSFNAMGIHSEKISSWDFVWKLVEEKSTVKYLDLSGSKIQPFIMKFIAYSLRENKNILSLKLKNCSIGVQTLAEFARALRGNNTLRYIDFSENNLGDAGKKIVADIQRVRAEQDYPDLEIVL